MTNDHGKFEREAFLRGDKEVIMSERALWGWLFMAFCYGAVAAVVVLIAAGKL